MTVRDLLRVRPATPRPTDVDPSSTPGLHGDRDQERATAEAQLAEHTARLTELQYLLWAEHRRALLVVLQGMDTSGKDGVIRHVFGPLNAQGCHVTAFKQPSTEELDHDYLWRIHRAAPRRGEIAVFNRSHYEDVLIVRVHAMVPPAIWSQRYAQINAFEQHLVDNGTAVVKFFLHISKAEQRERLLVRQRDPRVQWKFAPTDVAERPKWHDYMRAYDDALVRCSTEAAPWYLIPSDRKWYRNWAVAAILRETLAGMDPRTPPALPGVENIAID